MNRLADHQVELTVFLGLFVLVTVIGFAAARWRRQDVPLDLEQWGLGGRAFGNWVTWFLLGGDLYTAYTFVAVPTLVYAVGAGGYFAIPYAAVTFPLVYVFLTRMWSVAHVHGFVTPAEFVSARFGSRTLSLLVAVTGIAATMPYVALQLLGLSAVLKVMGVPGVLPLAVGFGLLALHTFNSGLRAPALISIVKDVLILWTVLAALFVIAMTAAGWSGVMRVAAAKFAETPNPTDGLLLAPGTEVSYVTLVLGSAMALFLYPHAITGVLAARNRSVVKRNVAALPVYTLMLGGIAMLGLAAIYFNVTPVGADPYTGAPGDRNTVMPVLFDVIFPDWCAGIAFAAIGIGALVPAAIMSIAAANLFTRNIYRELWRPRATPAEEARVGRWASLAIKAGALAVIVLLSPQFSIDLQLIGGVVVLQTLPALAIGLYTAWPHRWALVTGLASGLITGMLMLYQIPQIAGDGRTVVRQHFGGSAWPLANLGLDTRLSVYVGLLALLVNLAVVAVATPLMRALGVPDGRDRTRSGDYTADEGDAHVRRMSELVDGVRVGGQHAISVAQRRR